MKKTELKELYQMMFPNYAHLDYSSKITSAQAMETGLELPESGNFTSKWEIADRSE